VAEALLEAHRLTKRFGGLVAVNRVDLRVTEGETHAIIGPNGAGKTTLINQVAGDLRPDDGIIRFAGRDITHVPAWLRARLGLARSFQITSVFSDFTALDNVALAVQAHAGSSFRFWRPARTDGALREPARRILGSVGLDARAEVLAAALAHGEQRQLEVAMALATRPRLLLLDEPAAGMNPTETRELMGDIRRIREGGATILLIEHDMGVVRGICQRVVALDHGTQIAEGPFEEVRQSPAVLEAYLGRRAGRA
jgi:branched-chain amino acid transport system ATP-binding protein